MEALTRRSKPATHFRHASNPILAALNGAGPHVVCDSSCLLAVEVVAATSEGGVVWLGAIQRASDE